MIDYSIVHEKVATIVKVKNNEWDTLSTRDMKRTAESYLFQVCPGLTRIGYLGYDDGYRFKLYFEAKFINHG